MKVLYGIGTQCYKEVIYFRAVLNVISPKQINKQMNKKCFMSGHHAGRSIKRISFERAHMF